MGWIGALVSLAGTAASGIGSAIANAKEKRQIENERGEMNHWYNQQLYEDPTQRADYRAMMADLSRRLKKQTETAEAKNVVLGGTQEATLAQSQQNANAVADVAEQQMATAAKRNDLLKAQQRAENVNYDKEQTALRAKQYESWGNLANNAAKAFAGFDGGEKYSTLPGQSPVTKGFETLTEEDISKLK